MLNLSYKMEKNWWLRILCNLNSPHLCMYVYIFQKSQYIIFEMRSCVCILCISVLTHLKHSTGCEYAIYIVTVLP